MSLPVASPARRFAGSRAVALALALGATACSTPSPTDTDASRFLAEANATLLRLSLHANQAGWVQQTYITDDTGAMAARADDAYVTALTEFAKRAALMDTADAPPEERRQLEVLRNTLTMAAPANADHAAELTRLVTAMGGRYGQGKYCPDGGAPDACLDVEAITEIMAQSRDPDRLLDVWTGWRTIAPPMRSGYERFVELSNAGARELGFPDTGAMWRSRYDMPPDAFAQEMERLWEQLRPLYLSLHAYVRSRLHDRYGEAVPAAGPLPAHLLGNIWAQDWSNVYELVSPRGSPPAYSLTEVLASRRASPEAMVTYGEDFFVSLGFDPLPETFWTRSLFVKPRDREVVCHASAWYIDSADDLRIKMCIDPTAEDFTTVHHELGHVFYSREYRGLPFLLRDSANDGFHEAIGDTIVLSITPEYLQAAGLIDRVPDASDDIPLLLRTALEKLAFLPFALVVDEWRWQVFSGAVPPGEYNAAWWRLRERYQGVAPAHPRGEEFFDPGAKYHVPANTPYARYFLAAVLQFQMHRGLARSAGCTEPLHRCSIYGHAAAGERLRAALALGASQPWPDVLETLTGEREMDASAIAEYFAPLAEWLERENTGRTVGW